MEEVMIRGVPFGVQETPCPYLGGRTFYSETIYVPEVDEEGLESLLSIGFRHFGATFFRPVCDGCGSCIPLRVNVSQFRFTRNRRRVMRRVEGLSVELKEPAADAEKHELYLRHGERFDLGGNDSYEGFKESFFRHVPFGRVLEIRRNGRLISASHLDVTTNLISAIYCYWDPDERSLSLGTFSVLKEVEIAAARGIAHLYLGYYVAENRHMNYKVRFYPNEALIQEGLWLPFYDEEGKQVSSEPQSHGFLPVLRIEHDSDAP
jgi:arginine-tRNA-protein transferase